MHKTIIATEANSRFTCFVPVTRPLSLTQLHQQLSMQWQQLFIDMIIHNHLLPNSDAVLWLHQLSELKFNINWTRNTDLSINGHIRDAGLWVTQTLADQQLDELSPKLADDLASYLNGKVKRSNQNKEIFIPLARLFEYCQKTILAPQTQSITPTSSITLPNNVVRFSDYIKNKSTNTVLLAKHG